jgi:hypothetical protein
MKTMHAIMPSPVKLMPTAMPIMALKLRLLESVRLLELERLLEPAGPLEPVDESDVSGGSRDFTLRVLAMEGKVQKLLYVVEEASDADTDVDCTTTSAELFVILKIGVQNDSG